ncbi:hypothetical protein [Curtobacterium aurantiacum]|uniref:hypothetical protein n=1 Tax=Curtobacterium aurantiacum TaxID=3236919 RepID=UPI001BDE41A5|nr:hypothetical protein [Curtobacterium flaccumfaciens]MBT1680852.1 hypothetical protein [Curtobacterium flaccumfaciens pv. flaccumfaciens]
MIARSRRRRPFRRRSVAGVTAVVLVALVLAACSGAHPRMSDDEVLSDSWTEQVRHRWAGQPDELGSGVGLGRTTDRLSFGGREDGRPGRIRVSVTCRGGESLPLAVWNGRSGPGRAALGEPVASREIGCGHDEDLYVTTRASWITIGSTEDEPGVGWYAAIYSTTWGGDD